MERVADLEGLEQRRARGETDVFAPQVLEHVYLKLDFKSQFENARTAEDAKGFLRSVTRGGMAAHAVAARYGGYLLELQGSMIHVGLPASRDGVDGFVAELHHVLRGVFHDPRSRVEGWRMAADAGMTLIVPGRGIYGDESWVSLGDSANRPAKYLYAQLEVSEESRALKRFHVACPAANSGGWQVRDMDSMRVRLDEATAISEAVRRADPVLDFVDVQQMRSAAFGQVASFGGNTPSADSPLTYFGWVFRADLDGFSSRVEGCFDNPTALTELAGSFANIMDVAATFVRNHSEPLVQLPWAGDNFTASAVFGTKSAYDSAAPRRLVELSMDYDAEMEEEASDGGFRGWAHGIAGGTVHGNAGGNIYLAALRAGSRTFMVGAGEGFGRSTKALSDIETGPGELVIYQPDWERLEEQYQKPFEPAVTRRNQQSSLFRCAAIQGLSRQRARKETISVPTILTAATRQTVSVASRQHGR